MLGRLLKLFLLFFLAYGLIRWLLTSRQRAVLHDWARTLALALLLTSALAVIWHIWSGGQRW
jgi:hypothetical protein